MNEQKPYNWRKDTNPERTNPVSNTVPDHNYSIRDILEKFTTGQPINGMMSYNEFDGDYLNDKTENPDFDDFQPHPKTLDLVERQQLAKINREQLRVIEDRHKAQENSILEVKKQDEDKIKFLEQKIQQLEKPVKGNNILENPAGGK